MRREFAKSIVLAAASAAAALLPNGRSTQLAFGQLVPAGSGKQWATTWSDEFNTGASDLAGWTYLVGTGESGWGNNELESYTAPPGAPVVGSGFDRHSDPTTPTNSANVFVSSDASGAGALTIRAIGTQSGGNVNYTSGRIRTTGPANPLKQTYGLFEFRAKMPAGNGTWPALWMLPQDNAYGGWPTSGEVDIFEGKGQDTGYAGATLHTGPSGGDNAQGQTFAGSGLRPPGFTTTAWHTYSFKWDDGPGSNGGAMTFYIDGVQYYTRTGGWSVPSGQPGSAPFDKDFHIIMNLAVGGNFVGGQQPGAGTYDMQVDFVRAYSLLTSATSPTWKNDISGNWSAAGNWLNNVVPNSIDATAQFGNVIMQPRTATVDTPVVAGHVTFDNASSYTIGGTQTLTLSTSGGTAPNVDVLSGNHAIAAPLALTKNSTFTVTHSNDSLELDALSPGANVVLTKAGAGLLAVNNLRTSGVVINVGTVQVMSGGSANSASKIATLSLAGGVTPTATLDLADNDLMVTSTPRTSIETAVKFARNNGDWNGGGGISSLAVRTNSNGSTGLGVLSGSEYLAANSGTTMFNGFTVSSGDTLVKFTWNGDTDFSGTVNFDDYVRTDVGFNTGLTGWLNGDFDYSGGVNFDDYVLIDIAFNTQSGTLGRAVKYLSGDDRTGDSMTEPALAMVVDHFEQFGGVYGAHFLAAVPEPATLSSLGGVAVLAATVRRRRGSCHF